MKAAITSPFLVVALCCGLGAADLPIRESAAGNFAVDLAGTPDTRPNTWGTAGYVVWRVPFNVPTGARVRILRVQGDLTAWPKGKIPDGAYAGILLSLHSSDPDVPVSKRSPGLLFENCFLYVQNALSTAQPVARAALPAEVGPGGLLSADNVLYVKVAVWLNNTGLPIHIEPTFTVSYQIERGEVIP